MLDMVIGKRILGSMKTSQNMKLLAAMRHQWVTPREAYRICGTLRFSGRVLDLKRAGHKLMGRWVELQTGIRVKAFRVKS